MQIYQDLSDVQKVLFRRRVLFLLTLVNLFLLALVLSYGFSLWRDFKVIRGETKLRIAVTGEGKVSAKPDVAKITATVLTEKTALKDAQEENSRKSNAVVEFLKKQGVEAKDIKTVSYNIYPQYSYPRPCPPYLPGATIYPCPLENQKPKIVGYQVRNSLEVTIRDIVKAGDILGGVVNAGANEVSGISFAIDNPDELRAQARTKAVENARAKAGRLAKDLGRRVGQVVSFSEGGSFPPIIYAREAALGKGGEGPSAPPSPSVEPGENEIVIVVTVEYEFK